MTASSRNANFIAIIDRRSGRIVWTLGPHFPAGKLGTRTPRPVDQIVGQHDAHLIEPGLPGAGNLIVFDNQGEGGYPPAPLQTTGGSRVSPRPSPTPSMCPDAGAYAPSRRAARGAK